jgi:1,4-alpha-glucan branching enzyme
MCKVTFKLPQAATDGAKSVNIAGDFNNWDTRANPLRKLKSGTWFLALVLETGRNYQFRYFIDESRWVNDRQADQYVESPDARSDNSVVTV